MFGHLVARTVKTRAAWLNLPALKIGILKLFISQVVISMSKLVTVLNGPNLNLLGKREPEIYGYETLADVESECSTLAAQYGIQCKFQQSNHEGQLIDWIQQAREDSEGIIINPGAYSHTSIGILDALNAFAGIVLEVHVSNIHKRESFRHHSYVSHRADGVIAGFGVQGYTLAIQRMVMLLNHT